ncbi:DUF3006 domain-containing protein [bacterium]|nr:DUF3006 domain-containing protein [bacterium]
MRLIVDRIEENFIVAEMPDQSMVNIPRILVPDAKEGDVIRLSLYKNSNAKLKAEIKELEDQLRHGKKA